MEEGGLGERAGRRGLLAMEEGAGGGATSHGGGRWRRGY